MDIGKHCAISSCNQVDFLPFECDCCHRIYCLEHRTYTSHECPSMGKKDQRVLKCPLCKRHIRWTMDDNANEIWEIHHQSGECQPINTSTQGSLQVSPPKKKKKRCAAISCREILTTANQFYCTKCGQFVCLKHRFEMDHECQNKRQQDRQRRTSSTLLQQTNQQVKKISNTKTVAEVNQVVSNVATGTMKAMDSLYQKSKAAVTKQTNANHQFNANEICPLCQERFINVNQLIAHVNQIHETQEQYGGTTTQTYEQCPQCSQHFQSITALIQHVERSHGQQRNVTVGSREKGECTLQ